MIPRAVTRGLPVVLALLAGLPGDTGLAQSIGAPNSQPNPYRLVMNWARLPPTIAWGQVIAFDFDREGNVYVFHRSEPPILKFSSSGELLASWGQGMFVEPHGLTVDRFGFIWTADSNVKDGIGGQVLKFDSRGTLLLSLGRKGVLAEDPNGEAFVGPTGVAVAASGDIFVTDGHGANIKGNYRVVKFSGDGAFLKAWGRTGTGSGELRDPHAIAMDSQGRLFVADRRNGRVQIFDQEGRVLGEWKQFGVPENLFITADDTLYVSDSNSGPNPANDVYDASPYRRGIRVGSARDGSVQYFIPEESYSPTQTATSGPVGLGVDARGVIYAADVAATVGVDRMMKRYVR
jgi:sugar lactone lactonase YvrE